MSQPESVPDDILGARIERFTPMLGNIIAGGIISLLMVGGGLALAGWCLRDAYRLGWNLPFYADRGHSWFAVGLICLLSTGLIAGSVALAFFVRWLLAHDVDLCENGFRYRQGAKVTDVLWSQVASVRETILWQRPPLLKGPAKLLLPKMASKSYVVVTKNGETFSFDGNSVKNIARFGEMLRPRTDAVQTPWETVEEHA